MILRFSPIFERQGSAPSGIMPSMEAAIGPRDGVAWLSKGDLGIAFNPGRLDHMLFGRSAPTCSIASMPSNADPNLSIDLHRVTSAFTSAFAS